MGLSRSTFYDKAPVRLGEDELLARIGTICDQFECYGYRRVGAALRHQGVVVNNKKLRQLMRDNDLQPKRRRRYVVTTDSEHAGPIYPTWPRILFPSARTSSGSQTSPTSPFRAASFTWPQSWMPGRVRWSATPSADRWTPASWSRR